MSIYNSTHTGQEIDNLEQRIITLENNLQTANNTIVTLNNTLTTMNNTLTNYMNNSYNPNTLKMTYLDHWPIVRTDGGSTTLSGYTGAEFHTQEVVLPYLNTNDLYTFIFIFRHAGGALMENYWLAENGILYFYLVNPYSSSRTASNIWGYIISEPWRNYQYRS